ncbi:PIN domain-like protein [Neocallimastix sp. 'constans']|jgi:hypothetical protein
MGVKKLNTYVNENIKFISKNWSINIKEYNRLRKNTNKPNSKNGSNKKNEGKNEGLSKSSSKKEGICLILDGNSFFYYLGFRTNWFIFDLFSLIKLLQKYLYQLLAINNLEKLVIIFDGMDTRMKLKTILERANDRVKAIKWYYNSILSSKDSKKRYFKTKKICPHPLIRETFTQYLFDAEQHFDKLEVRFSSFEADADIANIANRYNGYVISNDSDFFIYNVPGYICLDSIEFMKNEHDKSNYVIHYKLYKNQLLSDDLGIPKETLPIFATLCGNDYLSLMKYKKFSNQLSEYECHHEAAEKINVEHYKKIVNLILDLWKAVEERFKSSKTPPKKDKLQELLIKELFNRKEKENNNYLEKECQNRIMDSINEYNLKALHENKAKHLNKEIMKSYYTGKIYETLLNVLYINHYKCTQYFENINKESCWNISNELRKESYQLILRRNIKKKHENNREQNKEEKEEGKEEKKSDKVEVDDEHHDPINTKDKTNERKADHENESKNNKGEKNMKLDQSDTPPPNENDFIITEYLRKEDKILSEEVNVHVDSDKPLPYSVDKRFEIYLTSFKSNTKAIKALPYYLIPLALSLRYLLIKKIQLKLFINKKDGKKKQNSYSKFIKALGMEESTDEEKIDWERETPLNYYEFEALLASCISALTFSFLHKKVYETSNDNPRNKKKNEDQKKAMNQKEEEEEKEEEEKEKEKKKSNLKRKKSSKTLELSIKENLKANHLMESDNMHWLMIQHRSRTLFFKERWTSNDIEKDERHFENAVQLFSEFINILIMNSNFLQILRLTNDFREITAIHTMYHYVWDESFYKMIECYPIFKKPPNPNKKISMIFDHLYIIHENKGNTKNYYNYLEKVFNQTLNAILSLDKK